MLPIELAFSVLGKVRLSIFSYDPVSSHSKLSDCFSAIATVTHGFDKCESIRLEGSQVEESVVFPRRSCICVVCYLFYYAEPCLGRREHKHGVVH